MNSYYLIVHKKNKNSFDCYYRKSQDEAKTFYIMLKGIYPKGDIVMFNNQPMADIKGR